MHDRATEATEGVRRKGSKNGDAPTGKRAEKGTFSRMNSRNEMSIANEIRTRNRRMIDAVVANHFKVLVRDMDNEFFNEVESGKRFGNEFVVLVPIVMESNM